MLGLDQSAHDGFERLIGLMLAVMLVVVVIRSRQPVGAYVHAAPIPPPVPGWRAGGAGSPRRGPMSAVITIVSF